MLKIKRVFIVFLQNYCGILEVGIVMLVICVIVHGIHLWRNWYILIVVGVDVQPRIVHDCIAVERLEESMQEDNEYRDDGVVREEDDFSDRMEELAF
jgi:hypothetical protein